VLLIVLLVLATRFALDWAAIGSGSPTPAKAGGSEGQGNAGALRGLDTRVAETRDDQELYLTHPGQLLSFATVSANWRSRPGAPRESVTQGKPGPDLTEIFLDANLGDYSQIMLLHQLAGRDKIFSW
jgi:hypothetical protein